MKNTGKINKILLCGFLSFLIPLIISGIAFLCCEIYPGGKNTILIYDLRGQLLTMYGYLAQHGGGFDNLFHSMSGGLGGNFFGSMSLYISPFDLIYRFIPVRYLPDAIYFVVLFKIGLCGIFCFLFISRCGRYSVGPLPSLILSCCYALMSYNFTFSMSPMWYDAVMLLPVIALSLERIMEGKKAISFIVLMTLCMISDYYLAYMTVIALLIYFVFRSVEEGIGFSVFGRRIILFFVHGLISAGLSSFILVPAVIDLFRGKLSGNSPASVNLFVVNGFFRVLAKLLPTSYSDLSQNQPPNIYCGSIVIILCLIWFIRGKDNYRSRTAGLTITVLYFISFMFGPVDRIWHGFSEPVGFSCRYSFTFVFFMICFAARGWLSVRDNKLSISFSFKRLLTVIVCIYVMIELTMNASYQILKLSEEYTYANRTEYNRYCNMMTGFVADINADPDVYGRVAKNFNYSSMDGALYGYDGLDYFSSSYNSELIELLYKLGLNSSNNYIREAGMTPPVASFLDVRYYMSYWFDKSDIYDVYSEPKAYTVYKNVNALPLAYCIPSSDSYSSLGDDPFENIITVCSDISPVEANVFCGQDYRLEYTGEDSDGDNEKLINVIFTPEKDSHFWFYREYVPGQTADLTGITPNEMIYLGYYLNDTYLGDYGFHTYRYCADIGSLNAGEEYVLTLEPGDTPEGKIGLYFYDPDEMEKIRSSVSGFDIVRMDGSGIELSGSVPDGYDILLTLPYEDGYKVYLDGVRTGYDSYRDALILIHSLPGDHEIIVKYYPPGLACGIIVSLLSLSMLILSSVVVKTKKIHEES